MSGNRWKKEHISSELEAKSMQKIKGYYRWQLNTVHENYAHVFVCEMDDENDLLKNWNHIVDLIAVYVQSEIESLLQRSNFYIWFFVKSDVALNMQKRIEDDTYSSKKFVVAEVGDKSEQERLEVIEKRLFSYKGLSQSFAGQMIQKVIIQNFRSYKGKKIFNFANGDNLARLVVLFAPNGMGKTSFFDGIEWTFTASVDRFKKIGNQNIGGTILKNTGAKEGEKAFVEIFMKNGEWVKREVSSVNGRTKKDCGKGRISFSEENSLEKVVGEERFWKNLMLQHHKIDGFIAAADPHELYEEWCGLWDPSGEERKRFEQSYTVLNQKKSELSSAAEAYEKIKAEYQRVNQSREFVGRLMESTKKFCELSEEGTFQIPDFTVMTAEEYIDWSNRVDQQTDFYRAKQEKNIQILKYVDEKLGQDMEEYSTFICQKKKNESELIVIEEKIIQCQRKKELLEAQDSFRQKKADNEKGLDSFRLLYGQGEAWYQTAAAYFEALSERENLKGVIDKRKERILLLEKKLEEQKVDWVNHNIVLDKQEDYLRLCKHLEEMEALEKGKKQLETELDETRTQISDMKEKISGYIQKQEQMQEKYLYSFEEVTEQYRIRNLQFEEQDKELEEIRGILMERLQQYFVLEDKVRNTDQKIHEEENLEIRLKKILEDTRNFIVEQQVTECPICHASFENTSQLLQRTYRTNSQKGKQLEKQRRELEQQQKNIRVKVENCTERYNLRLTELIADFKDKAKKANKQQDRYKNHEEEILLKIRSNEEAVIKIRNEDQERGIFAVYTKEGIENWHETWLGRQRAEQSVLMNLMKETEEKIGQERKLISVWIESLKKDEEKIQNIEAGDASGFNLIQKEKDNILKYTFDEIQEILRKRMEEDKRLSDEIAGCGSELEKYPDLEDGRETLLEKRVMKREENRRAWAEIKPVVDRVQKVLTLNGTDEMLNEWGYEAAKTKEQLQREQEKTERIVEVLNEMKYDREVENYFLNWKILKQREEEKEIEIKKRERALKEAEQSYQSAKKEMEHNLSKFFEDFQINEIYEKLEPHETLKTLISEFSFNDNDKPELVFKVVGNDDKKYSPEWYFSTAQLNVVAFSIFLGRALQTQEAPINSIFIDDPVGHFDEMNVVCFVDLLRNIIENTGRQLIISTHEERVFNLIRRKLPESEYPACYIDFRKEY